jgi:hypothetical protein
LPNKTEDVKPSFEGRETGKVAWIGSVFIRTLDEGDGRD